MPKNLLLVLTALCFTTTSQAAVLLFTDFDNTGVTGGDMTGVVWTEAGLTAPTSLGASSAPRTGSGGRADNGYFSPGTNVNGSSEGSPAWTSTWSITVGANDVELTDIVISTVESNSSGLLGGGNGGSNINLTLSTIDQTQSRSDQGATPSNLTYTTPITLTANQSYDLTLSVWELGSTSSGHFESLDSITFNGTVTVIPEPSSSLLVALGLLGLLRRRR